MIIIDKDFCSQELKDQIHDAVINWESPFKWSFAPASNMADMNGHAVDIGETVYEHIMFVSVIEPNHPYRRKIVELFESFIRKHALKYRQIIRIKLNIVPMAGKDSVGKYQMPHVDSDMDHKVFLYYINDADGDTYLFNETFGEGSPESFTVDQRVSPEAGKAVVFDGNIFHAPSAPTESAFRLVINIDFI
tara:strand:- start:5 stop:577 length:573 start_codon:yes stop_codon:yes gene_type:complete